MGGGLKAALHSFARSLGCAAAAKGGVMTFIRKWRDYLPTMDRPTMLAIAAVILVALACLFLGTLLLRQFLERTGLNAEIALVEQSLAEAKELQKKRPDELRGEIAAAQATLTAALKDFPNEAESMQEVDKIYQYASENQVEIVSLQAQPARKRGRWRTTSSSSNCRPPAASPG